MHRKFEWRNLWWLNPQFQYLSMVVVDSFNVHHLFTLRSWWETGSFRDPNKVEKIRQEKKLNETSGNVRRNQLTNQSNKLPLLMEANICTPFIVMTEE